ncbi:MAG: TIM barrel protein [Verrucomicrobia bacterium]|nr:TIM barrel protein [Verrucomicrobiota bacterium]
MLSLSTYWNGHRHHEDGLHMVYEAILLGFTSMHLAQDLSPNLMQGFYEAHKRNSSLGNTYMNFSGLKNFCPRSEPNAEMHDILSQNAEKREFAIALTKKTIGIAADLDARHVVLSPAISSMPDYTTRLTELVKDGQLYSKSYAALKLEMIQEREKLGDAHLNGMRRALDDLIPYAQDKNVRLGLECGKRFEQAPNEWEIETLLSEYDTPTLAYWHNFGHVQLKANLGLLNHRQFLEKMRARLIGCHVNDVVWPDEEHFIPFQGNLDFDQLIPLLPDNIPMVWEIKPRLKSDDIKAALIQWKEKYVD